jgi:hypothetical protein
MRILVIIPLLLLTVQVNGQEKKAKDNLLVKVISAEDRAGSSLHLHLEIQNTSETKRERLDIFKRILAYDDLGNDYAVKRVDDAATGRPLPGFVDHGQPRRVFVGMDAFHPKANQLTLEIGTRQKGKGRLKVIVKKAEVKFSKS